MYPPRSNRSNQKKKEKRARRRIIWMINLFLIAAIGGVGIFYAAGIQKQQAEPATNEAVVEQQPADREDAKGGEQVESPEADSDVKPEDSGLNSPETGTPEDESVSSGSEPTGSGGKKSEQESKSGSKGTETAKPSDPKENDSSDNKTTVPLPTGSGKNVTINFVGDIQFSGKVAELLDKNGYEYPFAKLGSLFNNDDLTVGNLETPITLGGTAAADKTYVYKSSPKALAAMADAGFDAVNLANNHILDQGVEGLVDTLTYLQEYGMAHTGAGMNKEEAYAPAYLERKGIKIALLGFSRVVPEASWKAEGNRAGVAEAYNSTGAVSAIQEARQKADLVIVIAHWGEERVSTPNEDQTRLAHEFVDGGADLVIGGHPHVLQGVEFYKGKWIAYSTGNFIFSKSTTEETWKTAVFQAECSAEAKCSMKVIPYEAGLGQAIPMLGEANKLLLEQMTRLSPGIRFDADGVASTS
ncbi:CapA family protein [Paenibacillus sp. MABNR03]|uniref:CapA family protein n=1 Tax=Paenibacillus sp. MABNR03 TaxID=3142626 RepID=UPI003D2A7198